MNKNTISYIITGTVILAFVGLLAFVNTSNSPKEANNIPAEEAIYRESAYTIGNKDAKVRIVEFSDFKCPACAMAAPYATEAVKSYNGDVSLSYRHYPLPIQGHEMAEPAAKAAEAAGKQGRFWEMEELLFKNQGSLGDETFKKLAGDLKLDIAKFEADRNSEEIANIIKQDLKDVETLGINSTPTFFVNGEKIVGGQTAEGWKVIIDKKLNQ